MSTQPRAAVVVTISDGVAAGTRKDVSGDLLQRVLTGAGYDVRRRVVVPDEADIIESGLRSLVEEGFGFVCTTGGTGLAPRDVTPQATRRVLERDAPGIAELIRSAGLQETKHAALSQGVAGVAGKTLIVNLPGSPRGANTALKALLDILDHALDIVIGDTGH